MRHLVPTFDWVNWRRWFYFFPLLFQIIFSQTKPYRLRPWESQYSVRFGSQVASVLCKQNESSCCMFGALETEVIWLYDVHSCSSRNDYILLNVWLYKGTKSCVLSCSWWNKNHLLWTFRIKQELTFAKFTYPSAVYLRIST